ncbi:DUF1254 domain-containing protein [Vibrio panuliri]|uniref:DUF1254 domain-containing protein n=1 Tax=Vibrio panuliri TaxID=1381081 RepID=A0ABX3FS81_9VIBR|nr:DUF1254 domain-containing protein [Vibrio panuliri]KAB1457943.1 DUF1254 domain-containing protein [Vibrio panuliri]OLQ95642.1 hypothetical protein BIY20_06275 [Vibrio panuliri]
MKKTTLALSIALLSSSTLVNASTADVIAKIDSSNWAVNPLDFGMTAMEYQQKEGDLFALNMLNRGEINEFIHFPGLSKAGDNWLVTPNVDTVYSLAIIDTREGFTIEVPEMGDRFMSLHIQDQNHTFVEYVWEPGVYEYAVGEIDTDYVFVGIRTGTDATQEDLDYIKDVLQPKMKIESNSAVAYEADTTEEQVAALRNALLDEWGNLPDMYDSVQFDIHDVSDWEKWTYTIAGSWGLSPESTAMYASWAPEDTKAGQCYTATFDAIPAKAFGSLTMYDSHNYLMTDEYNIVSTNRPDFKSHEDGSFTVIFGDEKCQNLAEMQGVNYAKTNVDGWRGQIRAYRPDVDKMMQYQLPELKEISVN